MPKFKYKIREANWAETGAKEIEGEVEAADRFAAASDLRSAGKIVISVEDAGGRSAFSFEKINLIFSHVNTQELVVFAHNLTTMMTAGLPLSRALSIIERQTKNKTFKKTIAVLIEEIGKGSTLSSGMEKFPKIFSALFVSMVRAGEEAGGLSQALQVIGNQLEKSYLLKKKIKGAMIYPAVVVTALILIGVLMFIYVVPTLSATFKELHTDLPASTKFIIGLSDFLSNHLISAILFAAIAVSSVISILKTKWGNRAFEFVLFRLPVVGSLVRESNTARTARTLSSLLSSGVGMIESIEITEDVLQNTYYKNAMHIAGEQAQKGIPLSSVFIDQSYIYPPLVGDMVEVGEETGKLSEMLLNVAVFYENEVDDATKNMSTIIEPVLMLLIGASVGFFAVSMITPMYSVMSNI
jgi:type IV pilus assembly protein PilC